MEAEIPTRTNATVYKFPCVEDNIISLGLRAGKVSYPFCEAAFAWGIEWKVHGGGSHTFEAVNKGSSRQDNHVCGRELQEPSETVPILES